MPSFASRRGLAAQSGAHATAQSGPSKLNKFDAWTVRISRVLDLHTVLLRPEHMVVQLEPGPEPARHEQIKLWAAHALVLEECEAVDQCHTEVDRALTADTT